MIEEVRDYIIKCEICCTHRPEQSQEPMLRPWSKVAVHLLQLQDQEYLITVDYYGGFMPFAFSQHVLLP